MALKTLLVPVYKDDSTASVLALAALVAKRYGATIEGVALDFPPAHMLAGDIYGGAWVPVAKSNTDRQQQEARQAFEVGMSASGIAPAGADGKGPGWRWRSGDLNESGGVSGLGRVFDTTVYARPSQSVFAPHQFALETSLFESGRPLLLAAPTTASAIGENICIAWNCSTESARTVAFAMPMLEKAKRVTVLTVEGGTVVGPSGADLSERLRLNGIASEARAVPDNGKGTGATVLAETERLGCDLLVKGAYTQSRLRQMIFGGATSHILSHASMPVFMAH
jgi:nucleotide-binding universal stress UspA family protein